jgi:hypothetical protein
MVHCLFFNSEKGLKGRESLEASRYEASRYEASRYEASRYEASRYEAGCRSAQNDMRSCRNEGHNGHV